MGLRLLDTSPLRSGPSFRRLWIGTSLQALCGQFTAFAVLYQIWEMTRSPMMTGVVGLALAVPMLVFGLWGGVLADSRDRRSLILLSSLGATFLALCLAGQAVAGLGSPLVLLALAAAQIAFISVGTPARKAMIPELLPREKVGAGVALYHASFQAAMLTGPALAGIVAGVWGVAGCYAVDAAAFLLAFQSLRAMPATSPSSFTRDRAGRLMPGLKAIWRHAPLRGSLLSDLAAMTLAMPVALFPMLNEVRYGGDPQTLGLLLSAFAAGGGAATFLSGGITRHARQGAIQLAAALGWGISLGLAGLVEPLPLTFALLAAAGAADTIAVMARGAVVQLSCAAETRGRVLAVEHVVGVAAPQVGNFRAGAMAAILPPGAALAGSGLLCVAAVIAIAATHPALLRFRATAQA